MQASQDSLVLVDQDTGLSTTLRQTLGDNLCFILKGAFRRMAWSDTGPGRADTWEFPYSEVSCAQNIVLSINLKCTQPPWTENVLVSSQTGTKSWITLRNQLFQIYQSQDHLGNSDLGREGWCSSRPSKCVKDFLWLLYGSSALNKCPHQHVNMYPVS